MERILGEELVLEVVQEKIEQMFVKVFDLKVSERAGF
jgi:hypothetical protein